MSTEEEIGEEETRLALGAPMAGLAEDFSLPAGVVPRRGEVDSCWIADGSRFPWRSWLVKVNYSIVNGYSNVNII